MRNIDILLFDGINLLDVAGPAQVFSSCGEGAVKHYKTRFVSMDGKSVTSCCGLRLGADFAASANSDASDLIVPGGMGVDATMNCPGLNQLLAMWCNKSHRRIISVCSGALLLANAGVLDGRKATTHWSRNAQVRRQFPQVHWQTDRLFIAEGNIYTSAGVSTGIDLSLAIVQQDHGNECALQVARELVVYIQRQGGQSQFSAVIDLQLKPTDKLTQLVNEMVNYPSRAWTVDTMAQFCNLTQRTLTRHFRKHLDTTPKQFLERIRVNKACELISTGSPIHVVLRGCGLSDQQQIQRAFKRQLGTSVNQYIERFTTQQPQ